MNETLIAVLLGVVQGILEWLPVSSEGGVAIVVTGLTGASPAVATRFALFLHAGTALSALAYYRGEVATVLREVPSWRPRTAFDRDRADLSFLVLATLATGVTGLPAYVLLDALVNDLTGGAFVALVGGLLVLTGLLQRFAESVALDPRATPDWLDAVLVGALQGLAILPGVSRSGTTVSALLLRGHEGESSLRLSFLLSIPAALAANVLVLVDDGVPAISPSAAVLAVAVSAVVGYLTVGALVALVRRVPFWAVCVGFGSLGVFGGALLIV
ncbi:undecaprenyl-diphosphatase [Halomicrobium zhouii]|uniref:Undecaprenyl-diphosphatase n=1 Tax=Halomicrobium zhouii TaxID=767519 RepID=A0A1I6KQ72_9EURY|nr:undecaprenyl-diphosphate phosphatase [Halomicrobium zhouii]SFR93402.1 undecaprenyl-diphosphatase [Halomicrobium zhouii]